MCDMLSKSVESRLCRLYIWVCVNRAGRVAVSVLHSTTSDKKFINIADLFSFFWVGGSPEDHIHEQ